MYGLNLVTGPSVEPVTLANAKAYCAVDSGFTADDALITGLISAARYEAETYLNRAIFNQTWLLSLDTFPLFWNRTSIKNIQDSYAPYQWYYDGNTIRLPKPKCVSVTSITYIDTANVVQTVDPSTYYVDSNSEPARILPFNGSNWPSAANYLLPGSVKITFVTGTYGDGTSVNTCPGTVSTAISLLTGHFYRNREGAAPIPDAFYRLLDGQRFQTFTLNYY